MTNYNANELTEMANSAQGSTLTFQYDAWGRTTKKALGGKEAAYADEGREGTAVGGRLSPAAG
jgi:YD repeat-containing protein